MITEKINCRYCQAGIISTDSKCENCGAPNLYYESVRNFLQIARKIHGNGWQELYRFPNGYGASIVLHDFSYGLELAVIKWKSWSFGKLEYDLVYNTGISEDVIPLENEYEMEKILMKIKDLPSWTGL